VLDLSEVLTEQDLEKQILRHLREFYPVKVDEIVLIATIQKESRPWQRPSGA
jgi:hypothetical protein